MTGEDCIIEGPEGDIFTSEELPITHSASIFTVAVMSEGEAEDSSDSSSSAEDGLLSDSPLSGDVDEGSGAASEVSSRASAESSVGKAGGLPAGEVWGTDATATAEADDSSPEGVWPRGSGEFGARCPVAIKGLQ